MKLFNLALCVAVVTVLLPAAPVLAEERVIYVGDCRWGEFSRTSHEDEVTGQTTVVICNAPPLLVEAP